MSPFLALLTLLALPAEAHTRAQPIEVVAPAALPAHFAQDRAFTFSRAVAADPSWEDAVIPCDRPQLRWRVAEGVAWVDFTADAATWPEALPLEGRCAVGGVDVPVKVVAMDAALDPASWQWAVDDADTVRLTKRAGAAWLQPFQLPAEVQRTLVDGEVPSTLAGTRCKVGTSASGAQSVSVLSDPGADVGLGTCALPALDGPAYVLRLDVAALPTW